MSTKTIIEPKMIGELNEEVQRGLEIACEAVKDDKNAKMLLDTLRQIHNAWSELLHKVIVMAVSISAMKYRTAEQIIDQVTAINALFQEQKEEALQRYQFKSAFNQ